MCPAARPCGRVGASWHRTRLKRFTSLGREGKYVIGRPAVGLFAFGLDVRAAEIRPPPEILIAISFVDGERQNVSARLLRDGAGRFLLPGARAVEATGATVGADRVAVDKTAALDVFKRCARAGETLSRIVVINLQRWLVVPGGACACGLVCRRMSAMVGAAQAGRAERLAMVAIASNRHMVFPFVILSQMGRREPAGQYAAQAC